MAISLKHMDEIEEDILEKADKMKEHNNLLQALGDLLSWLRSAKPDEVLKLEEESNVPKPGGGYYTYKEIWQDLGKLPDLQSENQFGGVDYHWGRTEREEAIGLLKAKMDSLNSESQQDMIELQGLMSKRDNVFQSISNIL
jgi:hypothetical protein